MSKRLSLRWAHRHSDAEEERESTRRSRAHGAGSPLRFPLFFHGPSPSTGVRGKARTDGDRRVACDDYAACDHGQFGASPRHSIHGQVACLLPHLLDHGQCWEACRPFPRDDGRSPCSFVPPRLSSPASFEDVGHAGGGKRQTCTDHASVPEQGRCFRLLGPRPLQRRCFRP